MTACNTLLRFASWDLMVPCLAPRCEQRKWLLYAQPFWPRASSAANALSRAFAVGPLLALPFIIRTPPSSGPHTTPVAHPRSNGIALKMVKALV
jgi:hypothetical protein